MFDLADIARALNYIDGEFSFQEGDKVTGEHWAEALAYGRPDLWRPWELERARDQFEQLPESAWADIFARAEYMHTHDGVAFDRRDYCTDASSSFECRRQRHRAILSQRGCG